MKDDQIAKVFDAIPKYQSEIGYMPVKTCARCGCDHIITFKRFKNPIDRFTHWAICPNTSEPILIEIYETP